MSAKAIRLNDKVKIISGFYEGMSGYVEDRNIGRSGGLTTYTVVCPKGEGRDYDYCTVWLSEIVPDVNTTYTYFTEE